jgi:hypothetical protein
LFDIFISYYVLIRFFLILAQNMDGQRALELMPLLQERLVILTGGRDRRGGPVLSFPASPRRERAKPEDYKRLLQYLMSIPKQVFFFYI